MPGFVYPVVPFPILNSKAIFHASGTSSGIFGGLRAVSIAIGKSNKIEARGVMKNVVFFINKFDYFFFFSILVIEARSNSAI